MWTEATPLLDRESEVHAIDTALAAAVQGAGQFLHISGGAGCGKTALLHHATARGGEHGFRVLMARGNFPERGLPYGLLARLFEPVLRSLTEDEILRLFEFVPRAAALLGQTDLTDAGPNASLGDLRALHKVTARLTSRWPLLIVVDDVQWADRPSLQWLATLPGRLENMPVLLITSVCNGEAADNATLLDELVFSCPRELRPGNLGFAATRAVVERAMGATQHHEFISACLEVTAGNPALLATLAATLRERPVGADEVRALALPSLASALTARLRHVSPHALAVVRSIAVLAGNATPARVTELTGIGQSAVEFAVAAMRRLGMITAPGDLLRMSQPLLRNAVMNDYAFTSLRAVLANAARLLQSTGAGLPNLAEHLLASPAIGEPWVADVLREAAAGALEQGDPRTVMAYLERACVEPLDDEVRAAVLLELGAAASRVDVVAALGHVNEAVRLGAQDASPLLFDVLVLNGHYGKALQLSSAGELTARHTLHGLWRPGPDVPDDSTQAVTVRAMTEVLRSGNAAVATKLAHEVLGAPLAQPEDLPSHLNATLVLACTGELDLAARWCGEAVTATTRWRHEPFRAMALCVRSGVRRALGDLDAAVLDAREGLATTAGSGVHETSTVAVLLRAQLARALVELDEFEQAQSVLADGDLAAPSGWGQIALLFARGRLRVQRGEIEAGITDLLLCGQTLNSWGVRNPALLPWRSEVALALAATDRNAEARLHADEEVALARHWGVAGPLGIALRAQGLVHAGRAALTESIEVLESWPGKIELVRSQVAYGKVLRQQGNAPQAREVLHYAFDLAQNLRLPALVKRACSEIAGAGGRARLAPRTGVAALTNSERRVALLALQGKTNRVIAAELFVQLRTVEIHLTNAYRKLGITQRDQLGSVLRSGDASQAG